MSDAVMTPELRSALAAQPGRPLRLVDPETNRTYLVVPEELFRRLSAGAYDDSPWTAEEQVRLAAGAGLAIGWADMDEYDSYPDAPK